MVQATASRNRFRALDHAQAGAQRQRAGAARQAQDRLFSNAHAAEHPFWAAYKTAYQHSLAEAEKHNASHFDAVFFEPHEPQSVLSAKAARAALFVMLYRGYPVLQLPFQLLNALLEIDEQLSAWRHRHLNMVRRTIGTRIGTGGSTGKDYLQGAADKHYIFGELAQLTSFLIERRRLPQLPSAVEQRLGFVASMHTS